MLSIYIVLLCALVTTSANQNNDPSTVRIYSTLAEIIRTLAKLPLEFSDEDWNAIRSDSITLLGENLNITLQTITEKKKSFNGTEVYIRSPVSADKTTIKLIKAILVDEINGLVKIQDPSIAGGEILYFNVPSDQIYYLQEPTKAKYSVDFVYHTLDSNVLVSYLRSDLNWQTQYQLNLYVDRSDLIAMANIRNDGKSSLVIDHAELIGGDINLQIQQPQRNVRFFHKSNLQSRARAMMLASDMHSESDEITIEQGKELAGLYVFPISQPFTIAAKTNYLLPMFRPHVTVERYALISKIFSPVSMTGKAQRSYRLKSDRYLSEGKCIIREDDRIVGETALPNLAAKDKHEFSIGEDADIVYKENITLTSSENFNETEFTGRRDHEDRSSVVLITRTRLTYNIHLELQNYKSRSIKIEYEQKGLQSYQSFALTAPVEHQFIRDSSSIKSNLTLKANTIESLSYTLVLIR